MYFLKSLLSINFSKNAHFIEEIKDSPRASLPNPLPHRKRALLKK